MNKLLTFILVLLFQTAFAQEHAWVYFKDKPEAVFAMANPLTMLSQRALDRRKRQNITLDFKDVPLSNNYYNQIASKSGILVRAKSKWLNAVHVYGLETDITALNTLNFVDHIEFANKNLSAKNLKNTNITQHQDKFNDLTDYDYGEAYNQVNQMRVDYLHEQNFTGKTMQIAVIDAGFPGVDTFSAFQQIRDNDQILGGYNFVDRSPNFYQNHRHGTSVLSTIAGFVEGELVGTAPNAKFYLFITEDTNSETPLEESLWVEAAEKADSLGVDVINTSLGYIDFDNSNYTHLYSDMDGETTFIARGANIASERGMIVVVSAGNSGNNTYFNIGTPADADHVFTVGAVSEDGIIANFSSYGPSYDNQIKPDADAKGLHATVINASGNVVTGNGTSYASPIMAGAIACFWEAFPNKTNFQIMQMVRESAHLYTHPTDQEGYGIPNFEKAFLRTYAFADIRFYPNPVKNIVHLQFLNRNVNYKIKVYNVLGEKIIDQENKNQDVLNFSNFNSGIYLLQIENKEEQKTFKILKK